MLYEVITHVGMHAHNDTENAVANTFAAVKAQVPTGKRSYNFV